MQGMDGKDSIGKAGEKSRLPPLYKKRIWQALLLYLLLMAGVCFWLYKNSDKTVHDWNARTPQAIVALAGSDAASSDTAEAANDTDVPPQTSGAALVMPNGSTAYIAIILTDAGLSDKATQRALQSLPGEVTMAFSPYSPRLKFWLEQAKADGHETLLLLPMEPLNYPKDDPGPLALLSRKSETDNAATLQSLLALGDAQGAMNFMGSRFLGDRRNMIPTLAKIRQNGMFFIENPSMAGLQSAATFAQEAGTSYLSADVQIDVQPHPQMIRQQLFQLEKIAQEKGFAIGVAAPYPVTLDILPQWLESLQGRGFLLTSPGDLLHNKSLLRNNRRQ